jgi:hypothetical protein
MRSASIGLARMTCVIRRMREPRGKPVSNSHINSNTESHSSSSLREEPPPVEAGYLGALRVYLSDYSHSIIIEGFWGFGEVRFS